MSTIINKFFDKNRTKTEKACFDFERVNTYKREVYQKLFRYLKLEELLAK